MGRMAGARMREGVVHALWRKLGEGAPGEGGGGKEI
jgi:hypothetical protein